MAWELETGDAFPGSEIQCRPVFDEGVLYLTSPKGRLLAVDAASGRPVWTFAPPEASERLGKFRNRGVTLGQVSGGKRIYYAVRNWLYAVDAKTGKPAADFGVQGRVDLRAGLGRPLDRVNITSTSPGAIYRDLLILGSLVPEDLPSAPGFIRAFDTRTGAIRWTFETIPGAGQPGRETWPKEIDPQQVSGGANSWPGLTLDAAAGTVFVPTGSASFDFWGGNRVGDNLYANCLLALDAATGKRKWHFQFVRHDVWDRDLPAAPVLVEVMRDGRRVPAVAQATKSGHVWVFDRKDGKPLFPIKEVPVPASDIPGEVLAQKQVLPVLPPPFARQQVTEAELTERTPEARAAVLERFRKLKSGPQFTPPSREGTIVFPGFDGGAEWGGQAFDPETGLLYVNANEMAWVLRLIPRAATAPDAKALYARDCAGCHRADLKGTPPEFPSLENLAARRPRASAALTIREGAGRMPGFPRLSRIELEALLDYVYEGKNRALATAGVAPPLLPFGIDGYNKFLDPDGYPAVRPPWGTLTAVDLNAGTLRWQIPLGEHPELHQPGTGSENYGGPVVTAGGLVFIGATNFDRQFRAFDKTTGELVWKAELPAGGNATPVVYEWKGRQYVVIACGGGKSGAPSGGKYVAFALPAEKSSK